MLRSKGNDTSSPIPINWIDLTVSEYNADDSDYNQECHFTGNVPFTISNQEYSFKYINYGIDQGGNEYGYISGFSPTRPSDSDTKSIYITFLDCIICAENDYRLQDLDLKHLETYCPNKNNEIELQVYKDSTYSLYNNPFNDTSVNVNCYAANTMYASMYGVGQYIVGHQDLYTVGSIHKIAIFNEAPYWGYAK